MGEIKKDLIKLEEGRPYIAGAYDFVITEHHTLSDIVRFCVKQGDIETIKFLVDEMKKVDNLKPARKQLMLENRFIPTSLNEVQRERFLNGDWDIPECTDFDKKSRED